MKILFLTLVEIASMKTNNIYADLMRKFVENGHEVYIISPIEKRSGKKTKLIKENKAVILNLRIGNIKKTNFIEKGISTFFIEIEYKKAIMRYFSNIKFDFILYSTPPITLASAIKYVKKRDCAKSYLILKDIFPQNAVDLGILRTSGIKGLAYKYFRHKEKLLYKLSDYIGCMSEANVKYFLEHNTEVCPKIVEVCPNSIEVIDKKIDNKMREVVRKKYGIPLNKKVFVYGGNLGKPQGVSFLIECLKKCKGITEAFFLVIGGGTEYSALENYVKHANQTNLKLMKWLPKEEYDTMVRACDVGMIFLDHRFTIPNFPSRLLTYMQAKLPMIACTDPNTDVGQVITNGGFGWWCESNDSDGFVGVINAILLLSASEINTMREREYDYLLSNYSSQKSYEIIMAHKM